MLGSKYLNWERAWKDWCKAEKTALERQEQANLSFLVLKGASEEFKAGKMTEEEYITYENKAFSDGERFRESVNTMQACKILYEILNTELFGENSEN